MLQVYRDASLSLIEAGEIRRLVTNKRRSPAASGVAAVGRLNFIDVSTMLRKEECAVGAGEGMREV
jgi:hypothetical protein